MSYTLHPHQLAALERLRASLGTGHKRPLLQMATGSGKTVLAAEIIHRALDRGNRCTFCVPALSLIDQTVEKFVTAGIPAGWLGVMQGDHPLTDPMRPIQIASVQTLARRQFPQTELVLVDEAHQAFQAIFRWMGERPDLPFVGLSATPWTRGLGRHYDDLLVAATTADLIAAKLLSPFRVYAPSHPDLTGVHTVAGDYAEDELAEAMDKPQLVADLVETWLRLGENRPTFAFAVNRAHARKLAEEFELAGVPVAYVDAYTDRVDRERVREAFEAGRLKVVVNVGVMTTGVDWPTASCLILARPTKSEMLFVQMVGRVLRVAPGKADALILDHSDTTLRLGLVSDIHHNRLDDGRGAVSANRAKVDPVKLPKECPKCHFVKPAGVHKCPACGFAPQRQSEIEAADGELVLLAGKKRPDDAATRQRFYSGFLWYCEQRGYRHGWAANQFKKRFGVWPRGLDEQSMPPAPEVRSWVTAQAIRYRKSQEAADAAA